MIQTSFELVKDYIEAENFSGYDPYDTLCSWIPFTKLGKWPAVLATQFQKRNPLNVRPLLGISKERNPKGIGLILHGYSLIYAKDPRPEYLQRIDELLSWLTENTAKGYEGPCWGYNFAWAGPTKTVPAYTPSAVATGFVCRGLFACYEATKDPRASALLCGATHFVLNHLARYEDESGICFSYTPVMQDVCYNASLLAAEVLARADAVRGLDEYQGLVEKALRFVLHRQKPDGHWKYSLELATGHERTQTDFHQGYVLESLHDLLALTGVEIIGAREAIDCGLDFYHREQFFDEGRSKWRLPKVSPTEIHNQSQGIITFSRLDGYSSSDPAFAQRIAEWTIQNMQSQDGHFHYQKRRAYTIRIPYMRWSDAWMFLALSVLLTTDNTAAPVGLAQTPA